MNRHNLPLAWHAATDMRAIGCIMIAYSSNCLLSQEWLASIAEGDSIINANLFYLYHIVVVANSARGTNILRKSACKTVSGIVRSIKQK